MRNCTLLTGGTGFLGTQIARRLIRNPDRHLVVLVRCPVGHEAAYLERAWWDWPELRAAVGRSVEPLAGDVTLDRLGLGEGAWFELAARTTHIIHAAADLRLNGSHEEMGRTNVEGTAHLLELGLAAHADHGLERFAYISTAYVAGRRSGEIDEDSLSGEYGFANNYERTKYQAERLVQGAGEKLPVSIFRPGMVVGDSRTGAVRTFNTLYLPLRLYLSGRLRIIPARSDLPVNLVPVDYVADSVTRLVFEPEARGKNFHLVAPPDTLPGVGELLRFVRRWARAELGLRLPRPRFLPLPSWMSGAAASRLSVPAELLSYFGEKRTLMRDNTDHLLGPYTLEWREFLPRILRYAVDRGFFHRSGRTVHEQILFRLQSKSRPITFIDIAEGRHFRHEASEVRRWILEATASLRILGIRPGDRVALVGWNSVRYLILDAAIGLAGAVSVPLYYTSPPQELERIIEASGARLAFIGAAPLLEPLASGLRSLTLVSFCRTPLEAIYCDRITAWEDFLTLGRDAGAEAKFEKAPAGPGDPATLRYTSGTTGEPKGVAFTHVQLRWMAETLSSLLPWRARIRPAAYLSFLPMNHVVEGILGTYAPYYVPAPVELFFLEDFHDLQKALPQVQPTIFFSVPRFYEKLWEHLNASLAGRLPGTLRRLLRPLLRAAVLRRAGLARCSQLIVGSAPCGTELLSSYRELGIEIHNAFGLTEAPLVTLNRVGNNRIGTVGTVLPETEIRIAEDGEVLARGPQVASGIFSAGALHDLPGGWLATGDLGRLETDGSLVLLGRKKEILITAYGKNIHPARIEAELKKIPWIHEAMVIGDGRPYCAALLWCKEHRSEEECAALDAAVARINSCLSHPEQIRRWAVPVEELSIRSGELTGNLKLRRHVILKQREAIVEALYHHPTAERPAGIMQLGTAEGCETLYPRADAGRKSA
jgi:long-chain acyl-CoA synthetase